MDIYELIERGENAAKECFHRNSHGTDGYYSGQSYENWLSLAIRFLESNFPNDTETIRFREIAEYANGFGNDKYHKLMAILKAFSECPPIPPRINILPLIKDICMNFNRFDVNIRRRYGGRETITINDEHDLQDVIHSILRLFINDVRPEDYVPSYAGGNSRVDFLLPEHKIIIETKMTNSTLKDKQIGEQLLIDFERYKQKVGYDQLICFVYDKEANICNPSGLINDLEKLSDEKMRIIVFISPQ